MARNSGCTCVHLAIAKHAGRAREQNRENPRKEPAAEPPGSLALVPGLNERITFDREELPADQGKELRQHIQ
jgi:hypothetical protein